MVSQVQFHRYNRKKAQAIEIKGELGNLEINFYQNCVNFYSASEKASITYDKFEKDFNQNYILELQNFIMYCQGKEELKLRYMTRSKS